MGNSLSNRPNETVLQALIDALTSPPKSQEPVSALASLFALGTPPPRASALGLDAVANALMARPEPVGLGLGNFLTLNSTPGLSRNALGYVPPPLPVNPPPIRGTGFLGSVPAPRPPAAIAPTRRKTFFSFHYADIMRVNNVRNALKIYNPTSDAFPTFYDSSLWESRKLEGDEALKRMIREGVERTSVVCVLIGTETWSREWVRYEIARSVIDKKGMVALDINGLNHHRDGVAHERGPNPLSYMAVGKMKDGTYRLFERRQTIVAGRWEWGWHRYAKFGWAVDLPKYLPDPQPDFVTPLDKGAFRYDFVQQQGHKNIGGWIDLAAARAGR